MQPPIPIGTILQNRYRLLEVIGQGGFGRTYQAEDQGRFNEPCAIKELIPAQTEEYILEKSKQLFQREAATLYQIQHPQVPQFRATFEQDQRLFLVQDYVDGKNYRQLLDERQTGNAFTEAEVLHLLRQLLPVLAHLHSRGIIHRDITPDNIILRKSDELPVLIDFGVVKELANRLQSTNVTSPTTVGKLGYAPSEQIQTGRAYPSSDLYALAVTSVVLLTGKEPQELFDDVHLRWDWQNWAAVDPKFAQILNRMLSYKPGDRYQSVAEVLAALQALDHHQSISPKVHSNHQTYTRQPQTAPVSQLKTLAVARHPDLIAPNTNKPTQSPPVIPVPTKREIWDNPWAIAFMGICVALLAGIGSWALVSYLISNRRTLPSPQAEFPSPLISPSPSPTPTVAITPTPTLIPSNEPANYPLSLTVGADTLVDGSLKANTSVDYTFSGEQGQQLNASIEEEGILLTVLGPNQEPIDDAAKRTMRYQGTLPTTGEYTIQLSPVRGVNESSYKLSIRLENPLEQTPTLEPTPTPIPTPTTVPPTIEKESISFPAGGTSTTISGRTNPRTIKRYLVSVEEGQELSADVQQGVVTLDIRYPNGQLVADASKLLNWRAQVPRSGNYQIDVIAEQDQNINFTLKVSVRDL